MSKMADQLPDYQASYQEAYAMLNPAQRRAVDQIEGPVMVIAGPGTGKTHLLTARIGKILLETDVHPSNILCLTFTDAGVQAMRKRLLSFIGPDAHRVPIFTFHSFCNRVIQENLPLFGRRELEPLSELERIEIIREIIDALPVDHPVKLSRGDVYFYEQHLQDLFRQMKAENWSISFVATQIDTYLQSLPDRPDFRYQRRYGSFQKGDLKQAKLKEATERMERLHAALPLFQRYQDLLRKNRRYDYEDMILWVLQAFREKDALLKRYQEQYQYFLVDEYQDTNGAQNAILEVLISYWENPNVLIVGDDDQSIFEFQGARLKNLVDFYEKYQSQLTLVVLTNNYRSSPPILDEAYRLILHNEKRIVRQLSGLGLEKRLLASHPATAQVQVLPQVLEFGGRLQEMTYLVEQLEIWLAETGSLDEVAVIYPRHKQVQDLVRLLEHRGIPYTTKRKVNVLDLPVIRRLRTILEYLEAEYRQPYSGERLLFQLLHAAYWGISAADLARISLFQASFNREDRPRWIDLIRNPAAVAGLGLEQGERFVQVAALLERCLTDLHQFPVPRLIEQLINQSGLLNAALQEGAEAMDLQALHTFQTFVRQEAYRRPRLTLTQLLETFRRMDENRLALELTNVAAAEKGVQLVTAHSAKGLEFERVILFDCVEDHWEPSNRSGSYRFSFPDTLTLSGEEDALEARRRLFYVGLTRAKRALLITFSREDERGKERRPTRFLDELSLEVQLQEVETERLLETQQQLLTERKQPVLTPSAGPDLSERLEAFVLTISGLNQYLRCPLSFYYEQILRVPALPSVAAVYGTAMHYALQRYVEKMLADRKKDWPSRPQLLAFFVEAMEQQRAFLSEREFHHRLELGKSHLKKYLQEKKAGWTKKVQVELDVRLVEWEGIPLRGTIDKLEFVERGMVSVVDYKTGSQDPKKWARPTDKNPLGGSYWRQLVFYRILLEEYRLGQFQVDAGKISYLEPGADGTFPDAVIPLSNKDRSLVQDLIRDTYARIMDQAFFTGCGESRCPWCNFARDYAQVASTADPAVEALDD